MGGKQEGSLSHRLAFQGADTLLITRSNGISAVKALLASGEVMDARDL